MNCILHPAPTHPAPSRRTLWLMIAALATATVLVYANALRGPFVYDDLPSIRDNPSIRRFTPLHSVLLPAVASGVTVAGRPVLNFSFALNHAISGDAVWSYHLCNVGIHLCGALALFGFARHVLKSPRVAARRLFADPLHLAFAIALLWALHPLQTQAIDYTVQRAESLMAMFYLITLYAFARGAEETSGRWLAFSVLACALGMATKEVMVTAPVMVLLADRAFFGGTFRAAWGARRGYYLALGATWLLLIALLAATGGNRGGSIGFGTGVAWHAYVLTQFEAVVHYVALSLWPAPLVFEYGTFWTRASDAAPFAGMILAAAAATCVALRRNAPLGFAAAWFFGILAPTSLSPGTTQMIVEHRMYLPLGAIVAVVVIATTRATGRRAAAAGVLALAALALTARARNRVYRTELTLWSDTLAKRPDNPRAHENYANALLHAGRLADAIAHHTRAVELKPDEPHSRYNLALALAQAGRADEAVGEYRRALALAPRDASIHNNLALALAQQGALPEAAVHTATAIALAPANAEFHYNHALFLQALGRLTDAAAEYAVAVRLRPDHVAAHNNLGGVLLQVGDFDAAIAHYEAALAADPASTEARSNLTVARSKRERTRSPQAASEARLRFQAGNAQFQRGDLSAAAASYAAALEWQPRNTDLRFNLAAALAKLGQAHAAIAQYETVLRFAPDDATAEAELANVLAHSNRRAEAIAHFEHALVLKPDFPVAREQLMRLRDARTPP